MTDHDAPALDKRAVRAAFGRAAAGYDTNAVLQREVGARLLARLDYIRLDPKAILDIGCGTGVPTRALACRYRSARVVGIDVVAAMTRVARRRSGAHLPFGLGHGLARERYVCADAERLPFESARFDLVFSNLTLQWCDPDAVFRECRRVLRPGGLLLFTSFGPDTLKELRAAWRAADAGVHVHDFIDMHDLGDALVRARLSDPVMDTERLTLTYADVGAVLRDLKSIGAHNAARGRHAALTGKQRFARFRSAYEAVRNADGVLPATYEVVYGHAWSVETGGQQMLADGRVAVGLDALRRR
jgi:malonyl-CoA O-methyltransferase